MNWENTPQEILIGKTVLSVTVSDYVLTIETNEGNCNFGVHGDCCSETWWSDINGVDKITGKKIAAIKENEEGLKEYNAEDGRCRQDYDSVYSFSLVAENGEKADFYYRNSSNGYYGGYILLYDSEALSFEKFDFVINDWKSK